MKRSILRAAPTSLAALSACALLCSCGFMTPAQQYPGQPRHPSEIAVIQSYHGSPLGEEYHATIAGVATPSPTGAPSVRRFGLRGFTDYPREIELNPGRYTLELYCFKSLGKPTYRPTLEITVEAGFAYTVKCDAGSGKATAFVSQAVHAL